MPGPLAHHRGSGDGGVPRPPSPPGVVRRPALRRLASQPSAVDHASALPPEVARALRLVAAELRNMPRDCTRDREELVHWHNRLARRLEAVVASKSRTPAPPRAEANLAPVSAAPPIVAAAAAVAPPAQTRRTRGPSYAAPAVQPAPRALPARTAPATRWRARPADAGFRRRSEAAGQLRLGE